ncbi:MAG: LysM peptidoglycan-binding domain-containing protein [Anaerolineales bacterium]|nr:LysM peptidoglycan-binding domain-containing protein [Anaerolineales bacterium]
MNDQGADISQSESQLCPTCGTKLSGDAVRCVVCGSDLRPGGGTKIRRQRPQVTLSLTLALFLLVIFTLLAAGLTFAAMRFTPLGEQTTPTATLTITPTMTLTPEPTATETPEPTYTPNPPIEYRIAEGDSCAGLAFFYDVSVRSIIELNNLGVECLLSIGQTILIPNPTATATLEPTQTLSPAEATEAACEKVNYTVQTNDTLSSIAENYQVSMQAIKEYNGMTGDTVFEGQLLRIPLCERLTFGPTPTPTNPPPYPAPNLLLPQDGSPFTLENDTVTLQWASVGQLRENEYYEVTVEDITEGTGRRIIIELVKDTKFIVPADFRPDEAVPHLMRWWVRTVRTAGLTPSGETQYESAGATSLKRGFTWSGAVLQSTPTP